MAATPGQLHPGGVGAWGPENTRAALVPGHEGSKVALRTWLKPWKEPRWVLPNTVKNI